MSAVITLKGHVDGLEFLIKPSACVEEIAKEIEKKFTKEQNFFKDADISIIFKGKTLTDAEKAYLQHKILKTMGQKAKIDFKGADKTIKTDFHRGIVRSGTKIQSSGNMIILGDVNPGAELIAKGNIVVLGALRGVAHAGCEGSRDAIISALNMNPSQIRIADIYSRSPENQQNLKAVPEIAYLKDGEIIIETL